MYAPRLRVGVAIVVVGLTTVQLKTDQREFVIPSADEQRDWSRLSDDDRVALLKPVMTLEEVNQLWQGKPIGNDGCGMTFDEKGHVGGVLWRITFLKTAGYSDVQRLTFVYVRFSEREGWVLKDFDGPSFRYRQKDGVYVRVPVLAKR